MSQIKIVRTEIIGTETEMLIAQANKVRRKKVRELAWTGKVSALTEMALDEILRSKPSKTLTAEIKKIQNDLSTVLTPREGSALFVIRSAVKNGNLSHIKGELDLVLPSLAFAPHAWDVVFDASEKILNRYIYWGMTEPALRVFKEFALHGPNRYKERVGAFFDDYKDVLTFWPSPAKTIAMEILRHAQPAPDIK